MFRLSEFLREIKSPTPVLPRRDPPGPVVIWNLIRRCNLRCKHCYSISGDVDFPGELTRAEVFRVMDELKACKVPALILSGGEPLLRPDIFEISARAKASGFYVGLSSNGALISRENIDRITAVGYDYIGVSLDGIDATHDRFRGKIGSFRAALDGVRLCRDRGLKVGLRFTMTMDNHHELDDVLDLAAAEHIGKFYLSHLVYAGRGNKNRTDDAALHITRHRMERLFDRAWSHLEEGSATEFVTGNNDADGVFLYLWARRRFPHRARHLRAKLVHWGGNASGINVANIDNLGNVHPDTFWWGCSLGNVRTRSFAEIWSDRSNPLMAGLRSRPRPVKGRCGACRHLDICGGNTRVRALRLTGDAWAEDPACYLTDEEVGIAPRQRVAVTPFRGARNEARRRHSV
jgi:heme d1 biosynthesis radical SAM protein NirJ